MTWAISSPTENCLSVLEDEGVRKFVVARARGEDTFDDIGAELYFWGWLRNNGHDAYLVEDEGMPDVRIDGPVVFWSEVKRIKPDSSEQRIRTVLKKANKQLRAADAEKAGVVFVHVDRNAPPDILGDDAIPSDVQERIDQVMRTLSGDMCRSVSLVVVAWDEIFPHEDHVEYADHYATRRKSVVLKHRNPRSDPPIDSVKLSVGATSVWKFVDPAISEILVDRRQGGGKGISPQFVTFDPEFEKLNSLLLNTLRKDRVVKALSEADRIFFYRSYDMLFFIAGRKVEYGSPHVMLIIGSRHEQKEVRLFDAYRIYGEESHLDQLAVNPLGAMRELLQNFGYKVKIGDTEELFVIEEVVNVSNGEEVTFIDFDEDAPPGDVRIRAFNRIEDAPHRQIRLTWAYAINIERYRKYLDSKRR